MSDIFSERLRGLRGNRTKAAFSRELGIPAPMYHRYENGQIPKENNLRVIADHCKVSVDWLLGRSGLHNVAKNANFADLACDLHNFNETAKIADLPSAVCEPAAHYGATATPAEPKHSPLMQKLLEMQRETADLNRRLTELEWLQDPAVRAAIREMVAVMAGLKEGNGKPEKVKGET